MPARPAVSPRLPVGARAAAAAAVRAAAAMAAAAQRRLRPDAVRRKGLGDFVTTVDLRVERLLRRHLAEALPGAGFLGEETGGQDLDRELVWVVDPIDGTSNFARGLPHWAVAVALLRHRRPVLAVMWCEPERALYEAVGGRGAFRDGRRLRLAPGRWDDGAILGCQWFRGQQDLAFLARLQRDGARVRTFGCTVAQLADVARGRLDANVQEQGRVWDLAAPGLLVEAAGGLFTDWRGGAVFPFGELPGGHVPTVAAAPAVHRRLLRRLDLRQPGPAGTRRRPR